MNVVRQNALQLLLDVLNGRKGRVEDAQAQLLYLLGQAQEVGAA